MRSHLASATLVTIAVLVAGCGSGGSATHGFGALPKAAPASPAPPVVLAEPAPAPAPAKAATPAAPAAKAAAPAAAALAKSRAVAKKLRRQRAVAARKLHAARAAVARQRRRAARREKQLQQELLAAQNQAPKPTHRTSHKTAPAPITASDVNSDDHQRAARVIVVRFYDLVGSHDGSACDMLSQRYLGEHFTGADTDAQRANCATGVESLQSPVSVYVEDSGVEASGIWVRALVHVGDGQQDQIIHLVPFFKTWMIDAVEPAPSR